MKHFNGEITIIDDTCHATFETMKSAIEVLCQQAKENREKIAVIGTMPELGTKAIEYHREIGRLLVERNIDKLITFGANTRYYRVGAIEAGFPPENIYRFYDNERLEKFLQKVASNKTVFLFKGARRINLNETVERFITYLKSEQ